MAYEKDNRRTMETVEQALHDESLQPICLPLSRLEGIAGNFFEDDEIGRGGYTTVYKVITNKQGQSQKYIFSL